MADTDTAEPDTGADAVASADDSADAEPQAPETVTKPAEFDADYVARLRKEAVQRRRQRDEAVAAANEAAAASQKMSDELASKSAKLLKLEAALAVGVPTEKVTDFAAVLSGSTADEVAESAAAAARLFSSSAAAARPRATDPTQASGAATPLNGDPLLAALSRAVGAA